MIGADSPGGALWHAFPDVRNAIQDEVIQGDKVALRITITGTHTGEYMGIPPTGKQLRLALLDIIRYQDGLVQEEWTEYNMLDFMQQLGLVRAPAAAA